MKRTQETLLLEQLAREREEAAAAARAAAEKHAAEKEALETAHQAGSAGPLFGHWVGAGGQQPMRSHAVQFRQEMPCTLRASCFAP